MGKDRSDTVASAFSELASDYATGMAEFARRSGERLLAMTAPQSGERALDVGCGPGDLLLRLADLVGDSGSVMGIDLAQNMVDLASAATAGRTNVSVRCMDACALELPDGVFDVVVANLAVQFTGTGAVAEWRRVAAPGGRVAFGFPDLRSPELWHELQARYVDRLREPVRGRYKQARSQPVPDPAELAAAQGFAGVRVEAERISTPMRPEAAWASFRQHGGRIFLDALESEAREQMEEEYVSAARLGSDADGFYDIGTTLQFWCFTVPGTPAP